MEKKFITSSSFWDDVKTNKKLVEKEAKLIRKNFTLEEIKKLQLHLIDGDSQEQCVYGLMVGTCNSDRVYDFIKNNVNVLIKSFRFNSNDIDNINVEERTHNYFVTPLEEYIITQDFDELDEDGSNNDVFHRIEEVYNWIMNN